MNCKECKEKLVEYIEGLLDESQKQAVSEHLKDCHTCQTEFDELTNIQNSLIKNSQDITQSNLENKVMDNIVREQNVMLKKAVKAGSALKLRSKIMRGTLTKIAAAAAIIIAVLIINSQFTKTNVLWADVIKQINKYEKYKCRQRVVREQGPEVPTMDVYHLNLQQRRQELEDGTIHIIDMRDENPVTVELYPTEKRAVVTTLVGFGSRRDPDIIEMVKEFDQESTERLGTKKKDGKTLYGFRHVPNEYNDFTVWVDSNTKLPIEIELKHPTAGQTIFLDEFEFDFKLDSSAFSTEVPDGYEIEMIVQNYGTVESEEITNEDIRDEVDKTTYTIGKLTWIVDSYKIKTPDPLGSKMTMYLSAFKTNDGNTIIITQGVYYDTKSMTWIPDQEVVLETSSGIQVCTHPNGEIYAQQFLNCIGDANPELFDKNDLSEKRFTRMIVMPDGIVLSLVANKQMTTEKIQELVESLVAIK